MYTQENRQRFAGRSNDELRPVRVSFDLYGYATSSVLLELGNTKVLCSISLQNSVPPFLKGKKTGWLNAEYAMLPAATTVRTSRELSACKRNGRSVEISRLIGRTLRAMINCDALGEQTIQVDCDVLQADGSTRVAAITGAALALIRAEKIWLATHAIRAPIIQEHVAAVSVGVRNGQLLLDLDFEEDSAIDADFNMVLTRNGSLIELQGTAEKQAVSWDIFQQMHAIAFKGMRSFFDLYDQAASELTASFANSKKTSVHPKDNKLSPHGSRTGQEVSRDVKHAAAEASPLFSMRNRLKNAS